VLKVGAVVLLLASSGLAESRAVKPIDCSQLLTWIVGGIPAQRVSRLMRERGVGFQADQKTAEALALVGVETELVDEIGKNLAGPEGTKSADCPAELVKAAELEHAQNYTDAQEIVRKRLEDAPQNVDLHLALGYLLAQGRDFDEAFDAYADARDLDAEFPEIHNGLSYVFYGSNDAENAIAEARTALSIDPKNAEAYRYLGLGLYADENYKAARHAFEESLNRDPARAESYYGLGLVQAAEKNFTAAAASYQKAIRLNPGLPEARAELDVVLHELGMAHAAVAPAGNPRPQETR
jgi:tetratricopeptide (TPR) repeat protein